jgi:hypothetical protein
MQREKEKKKKGDLGQKHDPPPNFSLFSFHFLRYPSPIGVQLLKGV